MRDEALRAYAVRLLRLLESAPQGGDSVETELQEQLGADPQRARLGEQA
jgi:hypothetical protein